MSAGGRRQSTGVGRQGAGSSRWLLPTLGVLLVVATVAVVVAGVVGGDGDAVPTGEVRREAFDRWVPAEGFLRSATSTPLLVPGERREGRRIAWLAPQGTRLETGDLAVSFDPTMLEQTLEDNRSDLAMNGLRLVRQDRQAAQRLANLELDETLAEGELEHSRRFATEDELIYSRAEILESALDQDLAAERLDHAAAAREQEAAKAQTERELLAITRRQLERELERTREILDALEVRAPHPGILIYRRDWRGNPPRVGDTVFPGQAVAEIPGLEEMEVDVFVLEADAGGLEAGKRARVTVESAPGRTWEATVARVENLAKPRYQSSPVQYFAAVLELETTDPSVMKPGQRVRAELLLERVEDALTVPRQAIFERDGTQVVLRRSGGGFEPVPVTVVTTGGGRAVVEGALEAGDRLALADPRRAAVAPGSEEPAAPNGPAAPVATGGGRP